jgi:membrane protease YdiL (CAAX protease family)
MEPHTSNEMRPAMSWTLFAVVVLAWASASLVSNIVGIWPAIGSVALILGAIVIRFEPAECQWLLRPSWRDVALGIIVGSVMTLATHLMYPVVVGIVPQVSVDTAHLYEAFRAPSIWVTTLFLGPVILGEELVWRGVVQTKLSRRFGTVNGVWLAAAAYTLVQVPVGSPVLLLTAFACGLVWGVLRARTRSLIPVLVAHILWDVVVLLWLPLSVA